MRLKLPRNDQRLLWTKHVKKKMQQYQLSERRLRRVLRLPSRVEEGIAPRTIAIMQPTGTKKHPTEIWLMYQELNSKRKTKSKKLRKIRIISAWRYPGKSPIGKPPPIPDDILEDLDNIIKKRIELKKEKP